MEENDDDENDEKDRFKKRVDDRVDGLVHEDGRVIGDSVVQVLGELGLELLHLFTDALRKGEGVRPGELEDGNPDRLLVVDKTAQGIFARSHLDTGEITKAEFFPVGTDLHDDFLELFLADETTLRIDGQFKRDPTFDRLLPDHPGRDLHVLLSDRVDDIG